MAVCQISLCDNHGVHSCGGCGKLFCGMHGKVSTSLGDVVVKCRICLTRELTRKAKEREVEEQKDKKMMEKNLGCAGLVLLVGIGITVIGGSVDNGAVGVPGLLIALGAVGYGLFIAFLYY